MTLALNVLLTATASIAVVVTASRLATVLYLTRPWSRVLATAVLAASEVVILLEALGALRMLRPWPITLCAVGASAAIGLLLRPDDDVRPRARVRWPLSLWPTLLLATFALGLLAVSLGRPTQNFDSLNYHYPLLATWLQTGDLLTQRTFAIGNYAWYYPSNANLLEFWSIVFIHRDWFISLVPWAWFGVAIAAGSGVGRRLGMRILPATAVAFAFATTPIVLSTAVRSGQVDVAATAMCLAAVFFGLAWWQERHLADAILAGLALGLMAGTKYVTLPYAATLGVTFAVAVGISVLRRRTTLTTALGAVGSVIGGTVLTGGFWYVRNFILVSNPLFPAPSLGLPGAKFPINFDKINMAIATYLLRLDPHPWIVTAWLIGVWVMGILAIVALAAVPVLVIVTRRRRRNSDRAHADSNTNRTRTDAHLGGQILVAGWAVPLLLAAAFSVTPTSAGGPYGFPVLFPSNMRYAFCWLATAFIGLAAALAYAAPDTARGTRRVMWLAGAVIATSGLRFAAALIGVIPEAGETTTSTLLAGFALGAAATAGGYGVALLLTRLFARRAAATQGTRATTAGDGSANGNESDDTVTADSAPPGSRPLLAITAIVAVIAVAAGTTAAAHYAHDQRYELTAPEFAKVFAELNRREQADPNARPVIAYTAFDRSYPLYGGQLHNTVRLVTREYDPAVPGQALPLRSADEFVDAVCHAGGTRPAEFFVTRTAGPVAQLASVDRATQERLAHEIGLDALTPHETEWADARPELFRVVVRTTDPNTGIVTTMYAVNAAACPTR